MSSTQYNTVTITQQNGNHKTEIFGNFAEVVSLLALADPPSHQSKRDCPFLQFARLGEDRTTKGSLRNAANVQELYAVIGDYDAGQIPMADAAARLQLREIQGFVYTSASHTPDKPRWRVVCPLRQPIPPTRYKAVAARLNRIFNGTLAPETGDFARGWYFGKVQGVEYASQMIEGAHTIDDPELSIEPLYWPRDNAEAPGYSRDEQDREREEVLKRLTKEDVTEIRSALMALPQKYWDGSRGDWVHVAMALKSIAQAGFWSESEEMWHEFSCRSDQYNFEQAQGVWDTVEPSRITHRSIIRWARDAGWAGAIARHHRADFTPNLPEYVKGHPVSETKVEEKLTTDKHGYFEANIGNVIKALENPSFCGFQIAYDDFLGEAVAAPLDGALRPFKDATYVRLWNILEERGFKKLTHEYIRHAVKDICDRVSINSAQQWLSKLEWDGVDRLSTLLLRYFGANDSDYVRAVSTYLGTAMAGRVLAPGCKADMVPVLIGPQGCGKSTGVAALVPSGSQVAELDLSEREDDRVRKMRGKLICEFSELRGIFRADNDNVKAFISRTIDEWVPKYCEHSIARPRHCSFIATTNHSEFLEDPTGSRRWLPVPVGRVDPKAIANDRDQIWAEAAHLYLTTGIAFQEAERLAVNEQESHTVSHPWSDLFATWLSLPWFDGDEAKTNADRPYLRSPDILNYILHGVPVGTRTYAHARTLAEVLRKAGYERCSVRENGNPVKCWKRKMG